MSEKLLTDEYKAEIRANFARVRDALSKIGRDDITLLAATKTLSAEVINFAIDELELRYIGENRVQELVSKYELLHKDGVHIHFIGRLQKNKVKYIADKVEMIHSLDSLSLAGEINKQCLKIGKVMDVLVEVNIGSEESNGGIPKEQVHDFVKALSEFKNIRVCGLMVIPPRGSDDDYRKYFTESREIFVDIFGNKDHNKDEKYLLSMGMSDSYIHAAQCGSDIVRMGSALFGERDYQNK